MWCRLKLSDMKRSELNFNLPTELIAQEPSQPRDHCRLMVLDKKKQVIKHDQFFNLGNYLKKGDVLVLNQSKVLPARLLGKRGDVKREVLLLNEKKAGLWEVLVGGAVRLGDIITFARNLSCSVVQKNKGTYLAQFTATGPEFLQIIEMIGHAPTPPYIKQMVKDPELYQTIFAKDLGSAAAPTAGMHFTRELLDKL